MSRTTPILSSLSVVGRAASDGSKKGSKVDHSGPRFTSWQDGRRSSTEVASLLDESRRRGPTGNLGRRLFSPTDGGPLAVHGQMPGGAVLQMRPDHLLYTPFLNFLSFEARPGLVITSSLRETSHLCHGRGLKPFLLEATWAVIVFSNSGRMI